LQVRVYAKAGIEVRSFCRRHARHYSKSLHVLDNERFSGINDPGYSRSI